MLAFQPDVYKAGRRSRFWLRMPAPAADLNTVQSMMAGTGCAEVPKRLMKVDLAEPDGPITANEVASLDRRLAPFGAHISPPLTR